MTNPRKNKLTDKQGKFLRLWVDTGLNPKSAKGCLKEAGYSLSNPSKAIQQIVESPNVNKIIRKEMIVQGQNVQYLVSKLGELLEAMHPYYRSQPDNKERRQTLDMAFKLVGGYAPTKIDIKKETTAKYTLTLEDVKRLDKECEKEIAKNYIDAEVISEEINE